MAIAPLESGTRGKRVLIRGGLLLGLLAAVLFLPGPGGAAPVMLYDTLLLAIFAMLTIGITGPAFRFVALSAFGVTVVLPVMVLTLLSINDQTGVIAALAGVWQALTEVNALAGLYLITPAALISLLAWILGKRGYRLPGLKRR